MLGDNSDFAADSESSDYNTLFLLAGLAAAMYVSKSVAESSRRLNYESLFARIIAGWLIFLMQMLHTKQGDLELVDAQNTLLAIGPHRTSWDAFVVASKMQGTPAQFVATNSFDRFLGVRPFLEMFGAIKVEANPTKDSDGRSSNARVLEKASEVLNAGGCVALFPQGNFSLLGQEPPRVYAGAAQLALKNNVPITVIRLDGFWSLQNPAIPLFIRNSAAYRVLLSLFHMNNVRATFCCDIDFHLQAENAKLSNEEKINEICAQLYAYFRQTEDLTVKQVGAIKKQISDKTHLSIWGNKVQQDGLRKQFLALKKEQVELEEAASQSMTNS